MALDSFFDRLILWHGRLDRDEISVSPDSSKITLYAEHGLVDQLRLRVTRLTYADQRKLYPGITDTILDRIEKIQDTAVPWGRSSS
jgi:hypothetical protein